MLVIHFRDETSIKFAIGITDDNLPIGTPRIALYNPFYEMEVLVPCPEPAEGIQFDNLVDF